ncbi:MAG: hypothetical protein WAV76_15065 [Bacteroidota bacterium]
MKTFFRSLLIIMLFIQLSPLIIPHQHTTSMAHIKIELGHLSPQALDELLRFIHGLLYVGIAGAVLFIISLVGLFFFWRPSRELFIASVIIFKILVSGLFLEPNLWWSMPLDILFQIIAVSVIIMSYINPMKVLFMNKNV